MKWIRDLFADALRSLFTGTMRKITLMLYIVGSDLERKLLIHTRMLLGLMEGIYEYKRMTADNEKTDDYAILAETGGVCLDPDNTVTCSIGDDARQEYGRLREKLSERLRRRKENGSDAAGRKSARLDSLYKIAWEKNERWVVEDEIISPFPGGVKKNGSLLMTEKDEDGCVIELMDFIHESVRLFPARQYMLILCGHGGGPMWGFGEDERNDDEMIISSDLIRMMPAIRDCLSGRKLSLIGYDSCRMAHLEAVTAWSYGARNMLAVESSSVGVGWLGSNTVKTLLHVCHVSPERLSDAAFDRSVLPKVLDELYKEYLASQEAVILSAIDLDGKKTDAFMKALKDLSRGLADKMMDDPFEAYRTLAAIRGRSQRIDEYSIDLGLFAKEASASGFFGSDGDIREKYLRLKDCIDDMILRLGVSKGVFIEGVSGISLFFPDSDSTTVNSNWEKYLFSHRKSRDDKHVTWPFRGYETGLVQPEDPGEAADFCSEYDDLKEGYWQLAGYFNAIRETARLLEDNKNKKQELMRKMEHELFVYGMSELPVYSETESVCDRLLGIRDRNEYTEGYYRNVILKVIYEGQDGSFTRKRGLGYIPSRRYVREDRDGDVLLWFMVSDGDNKFPVHIYRTEGSDPFGGRTVILVPVLTGRRIYMLRILFEKGSVTGRLTGHYSYHFQYDRLADYKSGAGKLPGKEIIFLGSVSEGAGYKMTFFEDKAADFAIGSVSHGIDNVLFIRGSFDPDEFSSRYESVTVRDFRRDIFGNETEVRA